MAAAQLVHHHGEKPSSPSPGSTHHSRAYFLPRSVCCLLACAFLSLSLLHLLFCSPHSAQQAVVVDPLLQFFNHTYSSFSSGVGGVHVEQRKQCDYSEGRWVWAPGHARRYNATACNVKDAQDCIRNGKPDTGYLDWRWQPAASGCRLPAFEPSSFLSEMRGKHVAFVGDSVARNQAESLLCLVSAVSPYHHVSGDQAGHFKRWAFASHDVSVSFYWAPFLVRATGRSANYTIPHDILHFDALDDRWSADADTMDVVVINVGHWFWGKAVYHNGSEEVIGTHMYSELNHTEIGMLRPFRAAYRMSLERLLSSGRPRTVVSATFSPSHFEGKSYDDPTACARKNPYRDGETELGSIEKDLRSIVYEETAEAVVAASTKSSGSGVRFEVMDVTKLASLRPDGHPGPYMKRDPFAHGVPERMPTDCLHFCLPGPVDTFNDILLQILMSRRR